MKASLSLAVLALVGGFGAANLTLPHVATNQGIDAERKVVSYYAEFPAGSNPGWTTINVTRTTSHTVFTDFVFSQLLPQNQLVQLTVNGAPAFAHPVTAEPVHLASGIPVAAGSLVSVRILNFNNSEPICCTFSGYTF